VKHAVTVTLTDPPRILSPLPGGVSKQVIQFVNLNRELLLGHWNNELDSSETLKLLKRV